MKKKQIQFCGVLWVLATITLMFYCGIGRISNNPFNKTVELNYPKFISQSNSGYLIIEGAGRQITMLDTDRKFIKTVKGGESDKSFHIATETCYDDMGNIYILDYRTDENMKYVIEERILKYDSKLKFQETIFSITIDEDNIRTKPRLNSLKFLNNMLYFIEGDYKEYRLNELKLQDKSITSSSYPIVEPGLDIVHDFDIDNNLNVFYTTFKGDILDSQNNLIYDAKANSNQDSYSIAFKLDSDANSNLYFTDIGKRTVMKSTSNGWEQVMSANFGKDMKLADIPICYDVCVTDSGNIAISYSDKLLIIDSDGKILFDNSIVAKHYSEINKDILSVVLAFIVLLGLLVILYRLITMLLRCKLSETVKSTALVSVATLVTMSLVMSMTVSFYTQNYESEIVEKMDIISKMMSEIIDEEAFKNIKSSSDFMGIDYLKVEASIDKFFKDNKELCGDVFCVLYKQDQDIIKIIYQEDVLGTAHPLDWPYQGSDEQDIYKTAETKRYERLNNSEGIFKFVLGPLKDKNGDVVGLIEVGTDLTAFAKSTRQATISIIMTVMGVIVTMLMLITEMFILIGIFKQYTSMPKKVGQPQPALVSFIRPIVFIIFFSTNMATSFLPVYAQSLDTAGLSPEMAAACTMSAEVLFGAIAGIFGGGIVDKMGIKKVATIGCILFTIGLFSCGFAGNVALLIGANAIVGIGGGLLLVSINTYIASFDAENRNTGFSNFSGALLSGLNCGVVAGSMLAEKFGYKVVFIAASVISAVCVWFVWKYIVNFKQEKHTEQSNMSTIKFLMSPKIILYFVFTSMPYIISSYFILYFLPLFASENGVSTSLVAQAFLLNGVIVIYLGPILSSLTSKYLGNFKAVLLSRMLYFGCFVFFALNPSIITCFLIAGIMGVADSFGLSAQAVYLTELDEVSQYGEGKSMGISSAFENIAQTMGPFVFAGAIMIGIRAGIATLGVIFGIMFVVFTFGTIIVNRKQGKQIKV